MSQGAALRGLAARARAPRPAGATGAETAGETDAARCGLCPSTVAEDHRHLLHLEERRIVCVCETCWSVHSGDAEYRPAGQRTLWLEDLDLPDDLWASLQIPIGLAFLMRSSATGQVVALYPSPAGATECELDVLSWASLCAANPVLDGLQPDAEALVVNRLAGAGGPQAAVAPIDQCYRLVGMVKARWEGISGGDAIDSAVRDFFGELRERAAVGVA